MPPLHSALGGDPGGCFCEVCVQRGQGRGVDVERARTGFQRIHGLTQQCRSGQVPADGAFVSLWRIFTEYPEVFTWDRLWFEALVEVRKSLRDMVRAKKPKLELGWHIHHPVTLSPFFRARYDYNDYVGIADWIKPSIYHDCGAARFRGAWSGFHKAILADLDRETALRFMYGVLNMDPAREPTLADYDQKDVRPFSEEYVAREVRRGLAALKGRVPLYPGIGIDIPSPGAPPTPPETVYKSVRRRRWRPGAGHYDLPPPRRDAASQPRGRRPRDQGAAVSDCGRLRDHGIRRERSEETARIRTQEK